MYKCIPVRGYFAAVDIAKLTTGNKVGITLPKNLVVTGVAVKTTTAASGTVTVKAGETTLGAASTIAAVGAVYNAGTATVITADTDLTVSFSATPTAGKFEVTVLGFPIVDETCVSAGENKADADPYTPPEKA